MVAGMDSSTTSNENRRPKIKNATMAKLWVSVDGIWYHNTNSPAAPAQFISSFSFHFPIKNTTQKADANC